MFGSVVKQYVNGREDAGEADWLIGDGIWRDDIEGEALRSMKNPGTAYNDLDDDGGVHINTGIPNKAVYLVADRIGGFSGNKAARIWYATLRDERLRIRAKFKEFAQLTYINAWNLYPDGDEANSVKTSWADVGIEIS